MIGSDVASVYKPLSEMCEISTEGGAEEDKNGKKFLERLVDTLSGIFTPILPAITAAGMIKAVLALFSAFHWLDKSGTSYQVLNFMADAAFYFLPILLANSAAKKFRCNPYLAMMLGGILLHPDFVSMVAASKESGEAIRLFLLPITNAGYSSSVVPIILIVWFMSYVEPIADRISPKAVKFFTKPLITILVTGTVGLVVIGPIGTVISNLIGSAVNGLNHYVSWLVPALVGALTPLLVMTGTHYGLIPIGINNRMTIGYDTLIYPGMLGSNVACLLYTSMAKLQEGSSVFDICVLKSDGSIYMSVDDLARYTGYTYQYEEQLLRIDSQVEPARRIKEVKLNLDQKTVTVLNSSYDLGGYYNYNGRLYLPVSYTHLLEARLRRRQRGKSVMRRA